MLVFNICKNSQAPFWTQGQGTMYPCTPFSLAMTATASKIKVQNKVTFPFISFGKQNVNKYKAISKVKEWLIISDLRLIYHCKKLFNFQRHYVDGKENYHLPGNWINSYFIIKYLLTQPSNKNNVLTQQMVAPHPVRCMYQVIILLQQCKDTTKMGHLQYITCQVMSLY